jgi:ATP-dependent RNA helicase DDX56/DBP9
MKRKLDSNDIPVPISETMIGQDEATFASLGLDNRLLQGIAKQKFEKPTIVQSKAIPLVLQGRDVLARARTGTGKTAAYLLPILHLTLRGKEVSIFTSCIRLC